MVLCRADITTKNPRLVKRYLKNFDIVEQKMQIIFDKDSAKEISKSKRYRNNGDFGLEEGKKLA